MINFYVIDSAGTVLPLLFTHFIRAVYALATMCIEFALSASIDGCVPGRGVDKG